MERYNGKVLTVNGIYSLKCIGTHLYHPIVSDTNHWEKRKFPNSQLGISVLPTSPEQGTSYIFNTLRWKAWCASSGYSLQSTRPSSLLIDAIYLSVCYKVLSDLICWEWSPTFSVFVWQRNRQFQRAAMFAAGCILIGQSFWTWIGMQVQMWYLTLSTVKPIKLTTYAC